MNKPHYEKRKTLNDVCNSLKTRLIPTKVDHPPKLSMRLFLKKQISPRYPDDYVLMVTHGACSHRSKELNISENIYLLPLPPYCPELNPVEHLWDHVREKACANRYFDKLTEVVDKVERELSKLAQGTLAMTKTVSQMF